MLDLTGENLTTYLLREIRDVVNRNPRFRNMGGDVFIQTSNMLAWGDIQVLIGGISASGNRLSPDYFMCTKHGHAILAKLEGKDGVFIDWVQEYRKQTDSNYNLTYPIPGVYYFEVSSVDEATREVGLTVETYHWRSGSLPVAVGSTVFLREGLNASTVTPVDPEVSLTPNGGTLRLNTFTAEMPLRLESAGNPLTPLVDYWYERSATVTLLEATSGGTERVELPGPYLKDMVLIDQNGYELREGVDFTLTSLSTLQLGPYTPPGHKLILTYTQKVNPTSALAVHPENQLPVPALSADHTLAPGQVQIRTTGGNVLTETDIHVDPSGLLWIKPLLQKGETGTWDLRISAGQNEMIGKKMASNTHLIPGLSIGIGDMVAIGDQCAVLVSPDMTETYEVYGSKENISFDITVKANDRMTASEIASMIRSHLLIYGRDAFESNGLSIFEVSKSPGYEPKGVGGVSVSTTSTLQVSAAADWEVHVPLTVRIGHMEINAETESNSWIPKNPKPLPRLVNFGHSTFVSSYR